MSFSIIVVKESPAEMLVKSCIWPLEEFKKEHLVKYYNYSRTIDSESESDSKKSESDIELKDTDYKGSVLEARL